jgi:hypothetical protein
VVRRQIHYKQKPFLSILQSHDFAIFYSTKRESRFPGRLIFPFTAAVCHFFESRKSDSNFDADRSLQTLHSAGDPKSMETPAGVKNVLDGNDELLLIKHLSTFFLSIEKDNLITISFLETLPELKSKLNIPDD